MGACTHHYRKCAKNSQLRTFAPCILSYMTMPVSGECNLSILHSSLKLFVYQWVHCLPGCTLPSNKINASV